ncbi:MAG: CBS domain-containing protein [Anaerolineales bacterium]|nr:CBS domain-containing protein [Chloroflexota bacterium]MBL6981762.1 CBS domain-containing protein [Anaerolineales bacterium]
MPKEQTQTTALIVILHNPDLLPKLLKAWDRAGVPGVTILPSMGGYQAQKHARRGGLGVLINMFTQDQPGQRTVISLIDKPEILERAISEADRVVKGFDSPRSGILFSIPIGNVLGLQKWRETQSFEDPEPEEKKETSNLLKWFQEDIKETYGKDTLVDWSGQRGALVSEIIQQLSLEPVVVTVDTPVSSMLSKLAETPNVSTACVVNTENRLMGILNISDLAGVMMAPVIPEAYINDPDEYNKALKFAKPDKELVAADIMSEPVYAMEDATLDETFQRMKKNGLAGLPVVDEHYHVKGYLTLLELLAVCFPGGD